MKTKKIIAGKYEIEGLNRLYTIEKDDFQNTWDVFSGDTIVGNYIDTATTKKMAIMFAVDHSRKNPSETKAQSTGKVAPDHEFSVGEVMRLRWGI